jgi:hypothetical protein
MQVGSNLHPRKAAPTSAAESNRGRAELETSGTVVDNIAITTKSGTGF